MITKAYKYRIYPTKAQEEVFRHYLEVTLANYNQGLRYRDWLYKEKGQSVSSGELVKLAQEWRKTKPFTKGVPAQTQNYTLQVQLEDAFNAFYRRVKEGHPKPGYPKTKDIDEWDSFAIPSIWDSKKGEIHSTKGRLMKGPNVVRNRIRLSQPIGEVKAVIHRPLPMPEAGGRPTGLRIKREGDHWYAIYTVELVRPEPLPKTGKKVGVDFGVTPNFLITSDGNTIPARRHFRDQQEELAKLNRKVSRFEELRKKRGGKKSSRHKKAQQKVATLHRKIRNRRRDFHFKTALDLVRNYDTIYHENLQVKDMTASASKGSKRKKAKKGTNRAILDEAPSSFFYILKAKGDEYGREVRGVEAAYTSRTCSSCGVRGDRNPGEDFRCRSCGHVMDGDVNAAKNILARGLALAPEKKRKPSKKRYSPKKGSGKNRSDPPAVR